MFFEGEKIKAMREMILAETPEERKKALAKIEPYQRNDFKGIFKAMEGYPVTVRLLDPPLHVIGQGGFGITYKGIWYTEVKGSLGTVKTEVPVCIKEYFFKDYCYRLAGSPLVKVHSETGRVLFDKFKEKLIKEAKILSEVHHPYIVNVLEVFEENETAYIAMEYISGCSLKYMLDKEGILPEKKVLRYIQQIGKALEFVHGLIGYGDTLSFKTPNTFTIKNIYSSPRAFSSAFAIDNQAYIVGGDMGNKCTNELLSYIPSSDQWVSLAPYKAAYSNSTACASGTNIYVIGGTDKQSAVGDFTRYDYNSNSCLLQML